MCPVVSRFDAKRRRTLESRSPFGWHPVLRKAAAGGGEQAASRDRHAPSGMENAYRGACSWAVSRWVNPLCDVRFGAIVDESSRVGATSTPLLLCTNRGGEPIGSDAGARQGRHGSAEPCRLEGLYRFSSQILADFAIACVVERTRESVEAAGRIVLDMALSIWTC